MTTAVLQRHLTQIDGWWWPANDTDAHGVIMRDAVTDIPSLLAHVKGRRLIVQAGANVGIYPVALAKHFATVFTVEPDALNYECLSRNLMARDVPNIAYMRAAFGDEPARGAIEVERASNCGAHRVRSGGGDVEILRIDDMRLGACDCIWLDIEGMELLALKGAAATIHTYSPVICIEDKGLSEHFGIRPGEAQAWLAERGYAEVARIGRDKVFKRREPA